MKLLTIDTETSGLAPAEGTGVCDLAIACVDEDFGVYWKIESLIDPECIISPGAMGVHHITQEMVADKPTLGEFMREHKYPFDDADVFIGHNCLTPDHEVRTPDGWVPLGKFEDGESVTACTWDIKSGELTFSKCLTVSRAYSGPVYEWDTHNHCGVYTPDHRMPHTLVSSPVGEWSVNSAEWVAERGANNVILPISGVFEKSENPFDLTENELRLLESIRADANIEKTGAVRFNLKKERKIARLEWLCGVAGVPYTTSIRNDGVKRVSLLKCPIRDKIVSILGKGKDKSLGWWVLNLPLALRHAYLDELQYWDGVKSEGEKRVTSVTTVKKEEAEIMADVAIFSGWSGKVKDLGLTNPFKPGTARSNIYQVCIRPRARAKTIQKPEKKHYSGVVCCLTTPTGYFLVRRNGTTWVTGNCHFDLRFVRDYLPDSFQVIDTLKLSRILWPDLDSHKLQTLRYTFGLDAGSAHRAMGDVITTISLARHICEEVGTDAQGLLQLMNAPLPLTTRIKFGKHKGERLCDLPITYVRWLVDKADIEPDLREALAARL